MRPSLDVELRPLLRALENRIGSLDGVRKKRCDGYDAFSRDGVPFLHLEIRRDHMHLDLWLRDEALEEARSSGIARPHPFLGDRAVRVRFERAEDLTRVAHWLEASHRGAAERGTVEGSTEGIASKTTESVSSATGVGTAAAGRARVRSPRSKASDGQKRAAGKTSARRKPSSR